MTPSSERLEQIKRLWVGRKLETTDRAQAVFYDEVAQTIADLLSALDAKGEEIREAKAKIAYLEGKIQGMEESNGNR